MGTGSIPEGGNGRGVTLTLHPILLPKFKNQSTAIPLLALRAFVACKKVKYTYLPTYLNSIVFMSQYIHYSEAN
jgi:hypothetical protein